MNRSKIVTGVLLFALAAGVGMAIWYFNRNADARDRLVSEIESQVTLPDDGKLIASGFIEAEEIEIAPEQGGRITDLPFEEGDEVQENDVLVQIDTSILAAQRDALVAQLDIAVAERDLLEAGTRDELLAQAEAQVQLAQASVDAAGVSLNAAYTLRNNQQDLQIQIIEAETQIEAAQHRVNAANANMKTMNRQLDLYNLTLETFDRIAAQHSDGDDYLKDRGLYLTLEGAQVPIEYYRALNNLEGANRTLVGANIVLQSLQNLEDDPQAIQAQILSAQTQLETAGAQVSEAQSQLADLQAGARDEQLQMADARIEEAQAAVNTLETQIERMTLLAPINGLVLEQALHVGELATPNVPVVTLANLDTVELTVYINADQFDRVALNQSVSVRVDSFPGQVFDGEVVYIADEAEFTPRNVQTREERVNLVYAVKIKLDNPDHTLKPGMPADAHFDS